jgi:hypothetical protein
MGCLRTSSIGAQFVPVSLVALLVAIERAREMEMARETEMVKISKLSHSTYRCHKK